MSKFKYIIVVLILIAFAVGCYRIYDVNKRAKDETLYCKLGEKIELGDDITCEITQFSMYPVEKFAKSYNIPDEVAKQLGVDAVYAVVSIAFTNNGDEKDLDEVLMYKGEGLESLTWASAINPPASSLINQYPSREVKRGETVVFNSCIDLNKVAFSRRGWDRVYDVEYTYIMRSGTDALKVYLGAPNR